MQQYCTTRIFRRILHKYYLNSLVSYGLSEFLPIVPIAVSSEVVKRVAKVDDIRPLTGLDHTRDDDAAPLV